MATLLEMFGAQPKRGMVIADCVTLIEEEVADKSGFSGIAIKTGYKVVKSFKPGLTAEAVDGFLNEFSTALQPIVDDARAQGKPISSFFSRCRSAALANGQYTAIASPSETTPHTAARQSPPVTFGRFAPLKIGRGAALVVTPIGSPLTPCRSGRDTVGNPQRLQSIDITPDPGPSSSSVASPCAARCSSFSQRPSASVRRPSYSGSSAKSSALRANAYTAIRCGLIAAGTRRDATG